MTRKGCFRASARRRHLAAHRRLCHDKARSAGLLASASIIAPVIPPSNTLSGAEKKIVTDAALEVTKAQRQASRDAAGSTLDQLKKAGMQVTELPPAEIARLRDKMRPMIAKYAVSVGQDTVKAMQDELAKVRK